MPSCPLAVCAVSDVTYPELSSLRIQDGQLHITVVYGDKGAHTWVCQLPEDAERSLRRKLADG